MKKYITAMICLAMFAACGNQSDKHEHHHHHDEEEHEHHHHDEDEDEHDHEEEEHHHHDEDEDEHEHEHEGHDHEHEGVKHSANGVEFHDEIAETIDFELDTCRYGELKQTIKATAQLMPAQDDEHIIIAKACGIITLSAGTIAGNYIGAGEVIATTSSQSIEGSLRMQQQQAKAELERAEAELKRKEKLAEEHIVSQSELTEAQAAYQKAKAAADDLAQVADNGKTTIKATEDEYVRRLYVKNGQMVNPGDPIVSVSHNKKLLLMAEIQPRYYKQLQNISGANINVDGTWHKIDEYGGKLVSCGRTTSQDSPLLPVTFELKNMPDLVAGTFVDMYIKTASPQPSLSVKTSALIEEMGNYYVFVKIADEYYEKREVAIGTTDGQQTEIKSGIKEGDVVVSKGAIIVKLAMTSGSLDAHSGHVH